MDVKVQLSGLGRILAALLCLPNPPITPLIHLVQLSLTAERGLHLVLQHLLAQQLADAVL